MFRSAWAIALVLVSLPTAAVAQLSAVRLACGSDRMKLCPDAQPGRGEILTCLSNHKEELSAGCRQALEAGPKASDSPQSLSTSPDPPPRRAPREQANGARKKETTTAPDPWQGLRSTPANKVR
jgi:Cysteine rich repeat